MNLGEALATYSYGFQPLTLSEDELIQVQMKGTTPEAHAAAILTYFNFSATDEATFKARYGYDLRQSFIDNYRDNDNPDAHRAVGKGLFNVKIPLSRKLVAQIKSIKNPISSSLAGANGISNISLTELRQPTTVPKNATPAEREFYRQIDLFKTQAMNFGSELDKIGEVRTDYLKTIRLASDEFIELVKSGKITPEEGGRRANLLRNYLVEISRGKSGYLGRAIAEFLKKDGPTFAEAIIKYANTRFPGRVISALTQAEKDVVYLDVVLAAGRDRKAVSGIAPYLGVAGKVLIVASIAISVYNVATAEDKVNAAGREGSSILGGIAGGAAGGAIAGLMCGPGAPLCSGIGIFVGGAVGAFMASGLYDSLTSQ